MTDDAILELFRQRADSISPRSDGAPNVYPVAKLESIASAERELGVRLPPLLRRIYLEVGNGGCMLGPGYGLLGLPGGYDNDGDWNIVKTTLEMRRDYEWWDGSIVICDWGCTRMSCLDASDDDFPIYRFDGNFVSDSYNDDEPPDEAWYCEADTLDHWLLTPNCSKHG